MNVIQTIRKRKNKFAARGCVFGVTSVNRVAGEGGGIAEIFLAAAAIHAVAICPGNPRYAHSGAEGQLPRGSGYHITDDLVARYHARSEDWQFPFDDMKICAANSAGADSQQNTTPMNERGRGRPHPKGSFRDGPRLVEQRGSHSCWEGDHAGFLKSTAFGWARALIILARGGQSARDSGDGFALGVLPIAIVPRCRKRQAG